MPKAVRRKGATKARTGSAKSKRALATPSATLLVGVSFALALAIRLLYLASIRDAPFFANLQTNALRYHQWATLILDGPGAPRPPFDQPPGYAYLVALLYAAGGRSVVVVTTAQAVFDALTCALIAHVANVWFGSRAAIFAAVLAALSAPLIYFSGEVLPATTSLSVGVAAIALALHRRWLGAGILWAAALTLRSEMVLALPFVLLDAILRGGRAAAARTLLPPTFLVTASLLINVASGGHLVPLTVGAGLNLWLGNNPHADGVSPFVGAELAPIAAQVQKQAGSDSVEADRLFGRRALAFWVEQPQPALRLLLKKLIWTWSDRELPNTSDIEWQTAHSWLFARPFFPIGLGSLLPLALAGMILARRRVGELTLAAALLFIGTVTCTIFFTNARFRLMLVPSLIWFAAYWLSELSHWRRRKLETASLVGILVGLVLAWGNFYDVRDYWIPQIEVNTGIVEREARKLSSASQHLRRGVTANPSDAIGWVHLALALEQMGLVDDAVDAYLAGLRHAADSEDLRSMARRFLIRNRVGADLLDALLNAGGEARWNEAADAIRRAVQAARQEN